MRKYIILFFSVSLLLFACHGSPDGVIKRDVMINLLTDIHLADGELTSVPQIPDSTYKYGMGTYLQIFKKYGTDSAQFRKSFRYYTTHPDDLASIYDAVLKKLDAKRDSVTALIAKNNTAQIKNNISKPGSPGSTGQVNPLPARPKEMGNNELVKKQMMERMRMRRDSMLLKNPKKHAVSVK
jgi:hypothetical protein